jgi:hypothetical protein
VYFCLFVKLQIFKTLILCPYFFLVQQQQSSFPSFSVSQASRWLHPTMFLAQLSNRKREKEREREEREFHFYHILFRTSTFHGTDQIAPVEFHT